MLGITLGGAAGIGDKLQFSSFPENYYRNTGEKVVDIDRSWIFDSNPYVVRDQDADTVIDLWSQPWPQKATIDREEYLRKPVFFSLADRTATIFKHVPFLRHPRLYRFEDLPTILNRLVIHTTGKRIPPNAAIGEDRPRVLPDEIIWHIREAYRDYEIIQVGSSEDVDAKVIDRRGLEDIWATVKIIAQAQIFIGVDSGPYWIAACFPRIFRKRVLVQYPPEYLRARFVPTHLINPATHWHDHSCYYYNRTVDDAGVTFSYRKL